MNYQTTSYLTSALLCLIFVSPEVRALTITDPVEDNDGWIVSGNTLHFLTACCGISPTAGTTFLHVQNQNGGRHASKSFSESTLEPGSYTVTFDIGDFNNRPFADIDLSQTGLTAGGIILTTVSSITPPPESGAIQTWTLYYEVLPDDPNLGQTLGFQLVSPNSGFDQNASFDNLQISVVEDNCPNSILTLTVVIDGCDSGVSNMLFQDGCTLSDLITDIAEGANNSGQFVSGVSFLTNALKKSNTITGREKSAIQNCATQSSVP